MTTTAWVTPQPDGREGYPPRLMEKVDGGWKEPDPAPNPVWADDQVSVDETTLTTGDAA